MVSRDYSDVLDAAVEDVARHGYDSPERIAYWTERLQQAAGRTLRSAAEIDQMVRDAMIALYTRLVERGVTVRQHSGLSRFGIDTVRPELRAELDRRILASADLIKSNRDESVRLTLKRFNGWATSVPKGGSSQIDQRAIVRDVKKPIQRQPFEVRRVLTDQSHKLRASIGQTVAFGNGALAGIWHSHWRQANYDYRPDHKDRDLKVYAIRGNWALERGLMKPGLAGYYDEITAAAEEPFCRCYVQWVYALSALPDDMVTEKGRAALANAAVERIPA